MAALTARGLSKTFGGTTVLRDAAITVEPGEIRALLGQNGSGKSTLIKILTGVHSPDPGAHVEILGSEVQLPPSREDLRQRGVGVMHQDLGLADSMNVVENFTIGDTGATSRALAPLRWRRQRRVVAERLARVGLRVDPFAEIRSLTEGQKAAVALARALTFDDATSNGGVLILDEPTAHLDSRGVDVLFEAVRAAARAGAAIVFVGHSIEEVFRLCDTVTVLRDGQLVVDGAPLTDFTETSLIQAIIGRELGELYPDPPGDDVGRPRLVATGLRGRTVADVSLSVRAGEILGVTGISGSGHDELPELLFGAEPLAAGRIVVDGTAIRPSPSACMAAGLVFTPADRKRKGGDLDRSLTENMTLPVLRRFWRGGRMRRGAASREVSAALQAFGVRPPDPNALLGSLSGGNQQRVILAKWLQLCGQPGVLLLHEPTQGVDVGARQEIFRLIRETTARGTAIVYVSSEHEDLAHLCHRVVVLRGGRVAVELTGEMVDAGRITQACLATTAHDALDAAV